MYGGRGPMYEGYYHCWCDSEQHDVTKAMGILWQRADLKHYHNHHWRLGMPANEWQRRNEATCDTHQALYEKRHRAGFPGHEPIL